MPTQDIPRYAIYFSPESDSELGKFGEGWFGANGASNGAVMSQSLHKIDGPRIEKLTEGPRKYGFHGTLKPPFELTPKATLDSLLRTARIFARSLYPVTIPPLELAVIGKFIALTPSSQSAALEKLSAACVRAFEAFREPLSNEQIESYRQNKLTVHQEQMLEHWGYPYVMEEFRFHMSLTDRIDDPVERDELFGTLESLAAPVLGKTISVRDLTVFGQESTESPMSVVERIPFGRV